MSTEALLAVAKARDEFLSTVSAIRPELHRYCARLTGSVIEGEDIVQETLARAFYQLGVVSEVPPLRPWLFKIAHNAALDWLKSHGRKLTDPHADMAEVIGFEDVADPAIVRAAIARFLSLPVQQRSAVILKDVLGHSLEETAQIMETTVMAVKACLVRGRGRLRDDLAGATDAAPLARDQLDRYASLFNSRDWDGVRALIGEDCHLDLVAKAQRRGKEVGMYFGRYAKEDVYLRPGILEGQLVLGAYVEDAEAPSYFILLAWSEGKVQHIRDFRYVPYIADDAAFTLL